MDKCVVACVNNNINNENNIVNCVNQCHRDFLTKNYNIVF